MQIDNFGNNRTIVTLANGVTVFFQRKYPMACFIPERGFFRLFNMNHDEYLITHKYVKHWRSKDCQIISDSEEMEKLISEY